MGAIFRSGRMQTGKAMIEDELQRIVDFDYGTRSTDEDMYRGDFGSTQSFKNIKTYKGKSEGVRDKNMADFLDTHDFEKYEIHYSIIGQLGYMAYSPKVNMEVTGARGPFRVNGREFKNVTEIRNATKDIHRGQKLIGQTIRQKSSYMEVGRIGMDYRIYKTKPKKLPMKYQWISEYVDVVYGAHNPY